MGGCELDEGDEEGQRSRLADSSEDIEDDLGRGPRWLDGGVADGDDEEDGEGCEERGAQVFVRGRVEGDGDAGRDGHGVEAELADGDAPCGRLEAEVQHDLRRDGVDGAVEDPAFYCEGGDGEEEVGRVGEEGVRDEAVGAAFPFCLGG